MTARPGFVVWFTGLSGSGKSTLATLVAAELRARGVHVEVLDGDEVRTHLSKGLGFSRADRDTNVRRIGFVAKLLARAGACAMTAAISPYRDVRDEQRRAIGRFVEVYCRCPVPVLAERDPKGLYQKAIAGEIEHFTGVTDPYEEPLAAEVVVDTASEAPHASARRVLDRIEELGYLERAEAHVGARPPHGGALRLAEPGGAAVGPSLEVDAETAALLELAAAGALSPIAGPLGEKDATRVRKESRLESGLAWPLALVVAAPSGAAPAAGTVAAIAGIGGLGLRVEGVWRDGDAARIAGSLVAERPFACVSSARDEIERRGFGSLAGYVARAPLDDAAEHLLEIGLEVVGAVLAVVPRGSEPVRATLDAFARGRDLGERVLVVEAPAVPRLEGARGALFDRLVLKNFGATCALLDDEGPRDAAAAFGETEIGVPILAAGPVERGQGGRLVTARARGRRPTSR